MQATATSSVGPSTGNGANSNTRVTTEPGSPRATQELRASPSIATEGKTRAVDLPDNPLTTFDKLTGTYQLPIALEDIIGDEYALAARQGEDIPNSEALKFKQVVTWMQNAFLERPAYLAKYYDHTFAVKPNETSNFSIRLLGTHNIEELIAMHKADTIGKRSWKNSSCKNLLFGTWQGSFNFLPKFLDPSKLKELEESYNKGPTVFAIAAKDITDRFGVLAIAHQKSNPISEISIADLLDPGKEPILKIPGWRASQEDIDRQKDVLINQLVVRGIPIALLPLGMQRYLSKEYKKAFDQKYCETIAEEANKWIRQINHYRKLRSINLKFPQVPKLEYSWRNYLSETESGLQALITTLEETQCLEPFKDPNNDNVLRIFSPSLNKEFTFELSSKLCKGNKVYTDNDVPTLIYCLREAFVYSICLKWMHSDQHKKYIIQGRSKTTPITNFSSESEETEIEDGSDSEVLKFFRKLNESPLPHVDVTTVKPEDIAAILKESRYIDRFGFSLFKGSQGIQLFDGESFRDFELTDISEEKAKELQKSLNHTYYLSLFQQLTDGTRSHHQMVYTLKGIPSPPPPPPSETKKKQKKTETTTPTRSKAEILAGIKNTSGGNKFEVTETTLQNQIKGLRSVNREQEEGVMPNEGSSSLHDVLSAGLNQRRVEMRPQPEPDEEGMTNIGSSFYGGHESDYSSENYYSFE